MAYSCQQKPDIVNLEKYTDMRSHKFSKRLRLKRQNGTKKHSGGRKCLSGVQLLLNISAVECLMGQEFKSELIISR